jgi:hypothetical protein
MIAWLYLGITIGIALSFLVYLIWIRPIFIALTRAARYRCVSCGQTIPHWYRIKTDGNWKHFTKTSELCGPVLEDWIKPTGGGES